MMRESRRVCSRWPLALPLMCVMALASSALAQRLPADLPTAADITPDKQEAIDAYVKAHAKKICDGSAQLKDGRDALLEPVRLPVSTPVFKEAYGRTVLNQLKACADSPNNVVRLNVMVVAAEMPVGAVAEVVVKHISDGDIGVRYWAAKAVADVGGRSGDTPVFNPSQQGALLKALQAVMPKETNALALEQEYRAMGSLSIPEADAALLNVLNSRVALLVAGNFEGLRADMAGIDKFKTRLVFADAQGKQIDTVLRDFLAVTGKYLVVTGRQLAAGKVADDQRPIAAELVRVVEGVFNDLGIKRFAPGTNGPALAQLAQAGLADPKQFSQLQLNILDWTDKVLVAKLGVDPKKLAVPSK
jgi:hypothetical protein